MNYKNINIMGNTNISKKLYCIQKYLIIQSAINGKIIQDATAYAWVNDLYPYFSPTKEHTLFANDFTITEERFKEVFDFLCHKWESKTYPTYYECESHFSGKEYRDDLLVIFRYLYLSGNFDTNFWDALLKPGEHPIEAGCIISQFTHNELKLE